MVHGVNLLFHRGCHFPQSNNLIVNNYYGSGGMPSIMSGRMYGSYPAQMFAPRPYYNRSDSFLGKFLFGIGLGFLFSKIKGSGNSSLSQADGNGKSMGFFQRIKNFFSRTDKSKTNNNDGRTIVSNDNGNSSILDNGTPVTSSGNSTYSTFASKNSPANKATKNMRKADTSKELLAAINDANIVLMDMNEDYSNMETTFNNEHAQYLTPEYLNQISTKEQEVKTAQESVKFEKDNLSTTAANLAKAQSDFEQATKECNAISAQIADLTTKRDGPDVTPETKEKYQKSINTLNEKLTNAQEKLKQKETALNEAKGIHNLADAKFKQANKILSEKQTELKNLEDPKILAQKEKDKLDKAKKDKDNLDNTIRKQEERLTKLSEKENKKMARKEKREDKIDARSQKAADEGNIRRTERLEKKESKIKKQRLEINADHVEV